MTPVLLALTFAVAAPPADAELKKKAEALVAQLGDPDYRDREKAARQLLEMGYSARDAVLAGQKSTDTEISDRCKKLYPAIWRHDLDKRVQRFLDDRDGPIPDDLPGAARWLQVAGDGAKSRQMYAEMVKAHADPLLDVELHRERLTTVYADFVRDVYARTMTRVPGRPVAERPVPNDSEVLLFFFLGAAGDTRPATLLPGSTTSYYYQFLNVPSLQTRLEDEPMRKLFAAWLERERYPIVLRRGIDVAAQCGVKECRATVLKIAGDKGTVPYIRATALIGLSRMGTRDDIKELAPFLKDQTVVTNVIVNGQRGSVEIRDVALGSAVQLAGQSLTDFGFERRPPAGVRLMTSYTYFAFGSDEKRESAHQKWKEWADENLKK